MRSSGLLASVRRFNTVAKAMWEMVERTDDQPGTGSATYCSAVSLWQASRTLRLAQRSYANRATTSSCMATLPGRDRRIVDFSVEQPRANDIVQQQRPLVRHWTPPNRNAAPGCCSARFGSARLLDDPGEQGIEDHTTDHTGHEIAEQDGNPLGANRADVLSISRAGDGN